MVPENLQHEEKTAIAISDYTHTHKKSVTLTHQYSTPTLLKFFSIPCFSK